VCARAPRRWLDLKGNQLSGAFPSVVSGLPLLNTLDLDNNPVTDFYRASCPVGAFRVPWPSPAGCFQCGAGRWGGTTTALGSVCSGNCTAGYSCPAGSTNATAVRCPVGTYSAAGAAACAACPAGSTGTCTGAASLADCNRACAPDGGGNDGGTSNDTKVVVGAVVGGTGGLGLLVLGAWLLARRWKAGPAQHKARPLSPDVEMAGA
jgi:hypothetical protein